MSFAKIFTTLFTIDKKEISFEVKPQKDNYLKFTIFEGERPVASLLISHLEVENVIKFVSQFLVMEINKMK